MTKKLVKGKKLVVDKKSTTRKKIERRKKIKWDTERGPVMAYEAPSDVRMIDGRPVRYATKEESEAMIDRMEEQRWERMEKMRKEHEERKRQREMPKPKAIPTPEQEKQLQMISIDQPKLVEWLRTLDQDGLDMHLERELENWYDENSFQNRSLADHKKVQGWLTKHSKEERDRANTEMGTLTIMAGPKSANPLTFGNYASIDFSLAGEIDSPIRVDFDRWRKISSEAYRNGRPILVLMSPEDFLGYSYELSEGGTSDISIERIKKGVKDGNVFDVPYLYLDENGKASGAHEGRHRMKAFKELGIKKVPVLVFDDRIRNYPKEPALSYEIMKYYKEDYEKRWSK